MALIVDTGALIAFDRGDRNVAAMVEATRRRREPVVTSSGCVAQAWRGGGARQALLSRLLRGVDERSLDPADSRLVGELCEKNASSDVVDAHLASLARGGDVLVTSDVHDLRALVRAASVAVDVRRC